MFRTIEIISIVASIVSLAVCFGLYSSLESVKREQLNRSEQVAKIELIEAQIKLCEIKLIGRSAFMEDVVDELNRRTDKRFNADMAKQLIRGLKKNKGLYVPDIDFSTDTKPIEIPE